MLDELRALVGLERDLDFVSGALRDAVLQLRAPVVGALEVNCSDEAELECMAAFQRQFVEHLLPDIKFAARAPFRTCNLGARYEWGAVRVAEHHFALPAAAEAFKVLAVKINGHVSVATGTAGIEFGPMNRYDTRSSACGALHAMLAGHQLPALDELREAFTTGGLDRVAILNDATCVPPSARYLYAAIVSARLQAARALADIEQHRAHTPTLYLVLPCVTFNRPGIDTELIVGVALFDQRSGDGRTEYWGLGDDPRRYRLTLADGRIRVLEH